MKYLNKSKKSLRFSLTIFFIVFSILVTVLAAMLIAFPIALKSDDAQTQNTLLSKFIISWPESPLKSELRARKKLKRYARSEIQRRLEEQVNQMSRIYSPIYDLWLDNNVKTNIENGLESKNSSFIWPVIPDNRYKAITAESSLYTESPFVLFPDASSVKIQKGIYLANGEFVKSNFPYTVQKRYLILKVLPLMPGNIRASLGQYVWTKTFSREDVNKPANFIIPIYDNLGQNYKLSNISSSIYILDFKIATINNSGRETIYFPQNGPFWTNLPKTQSESTDPLEELTNNTQKYNGKTTLAKGYNVLVLNINDFDIDYLKSKKYSKLIPNLYHLSQNSLALINRYDATSTQEKEFALAALYKKYGYKTALFTSSADMNLDNRIASFSIFKELSKNWVTSYDAKFKQQNMGEDKRDKNLEGLSAVFKTESKEELVGLSTSEKFNLSSYLSLLPQQFESNHQLKMDENFVLTTQRYSSRLTKEFITWLHPLAQNRLLVEMTLDPKNTRLTPSLQNLFSAFFKKPTFQIKRLKSYSKMKLIDSQLDYIFEALQAAHLTHRTIIVLKLNNKNKPHESTALIFVPSLKPRKFENTQTVSTRDLELYIMNLIGIPVETSVNFYDGYNQIEAKTWVHLPILNEYKEDAYTKYHLIIQPSTSNCKNFIWHSPIEYIENISAKFPIYELKSPHKLEIYPCQFGKKPLELTWYQKKLSSPTKDSEQFYTHTHGYFKGFDHEEKPAEFYYGQKLITEKHFPIGFNHTKKQINELFLVDKKEIDQLRALAIQSFQLMQLDANLTPLTHASLFITEVNH